MSMTAEDRAKVDTVIHNAMSTAATLMLGMKSGELNREVGIKLLAVIQIETVNLVIETCRASLTPVPSSN
jgi:hypothetical protein